MFIQKELCHDKNNHVIFLNYDIIKQENKNTNKFYNKEIFKPYLIMIGQKKIIYMFF